jgi:hypothetical protein
MKQLVQTIIYIYIIYMNILKPFVLKDQYFCIQSFIFFSFPYVILTRFSFSRYHDLLNRVFVSIFHALLDISPHHIPLFH